MKKRLKTVHDFKPLERVISLFIVNDEILLPFRCHDFAKSGLLRLYTREIGLTVLFPLDKFKLNLGKWLVRGIFGEWDGILTISATNYSHSLTIFVSGVYK